MKLFKIKYASFGTGLKPVKTVSDIVFNPFSGELCGVLMKVCEDNPERCTIRCLTERVMNKNKLRIARILISLLSEADYNGTRGWLKI